MQGVRLVEGGRGASVLVSKKRGYLTPFLIFFINFLKSKNEGVFLGLADGLARWSQARVVPKATWTRALGTGGGGGAAALAGEAEQGGARVR